MIFFYKLLNMKIDNILRIKIDKLVKWNVHNL